MEQTIPLAEEKRERENGCSIYIRQDSISIHWDRPLTDGSHKVTRVEQISAGALLGIARVLTGKGEEDVVRAIASIERKRKR